MSQDGKLSNIIQKYRDLTGLQSASQMSDDDIADAINDYYQNRFPEDVTEDVFHDTLTQTISATDSGVYTLAADVLVVNKPVKIDDTEVIFTMNVEQFEEQFPRQGGGAFILSNAGAGLVIGVADKTAAKNGNQFFYDIGGTRYNEAVDTETALSGNTVPQNKYGAWRLEIADDGTVSIQAADDNATGYATPGLAVKGLPPEDSTLAPLGYVTAINTSAVFVPGTTELDAAGVTATFTDGPAGDRSTPISVLLFDGKLKVGPKSDDWRELRAPYIRKPAAMATAASTPEDVRWWLVLAYGAAIQQVGDAQDTEGVEALALTFNRLINVVNKKYTKQKNVARVPQAFI